MEEAGLNANFPKKPADSNPPVLSHARSPDRAAASSSGGWTLLPLCLGLAAIAACVIIPQSDANHRLLYERQNLAADLNQINQQAALNEAFLRKIEIDPQLAQRLAQRQMKFIPQGESLLPYKAQSSQARIPAAMTAAVSPFSLVRLPPPAPRAPYQPSGSALSVWLLDSHLRLYCLAGGLFLVAMGLILGSNDAHESGALA